MSWSKTPTGPPPLLGGAGRNLGHDGTVSSRARENLRRIRNDEDLPPSMRKPSPTPTPEAYGENKRKKQLRQQEEAAESPDVERKELGDDGDMKLGGGGRFKKLEGELSHEKGIRDPGALAASIGRKKYGAKKFASLGHDGKSEKSEKGEAKGPHKSKGKHKPAAPPMRPPMMPPPPMAAQMPPQAPMGFDGEPDKMKMTMDEFKKGELHSGSKTGKKVTNRKQAIAIGLSQARKAGQKT